MPFRRRASSLSIRGSPGGAEEKRRRAGTPGVGVIAAFGAAAECAAAALRSEPERLLRLRAKIESRLHSRFPELRLHGQGAPRLPGTVSFALGDVPGEVLAIALDLDGFAVSTGSACASGAVEPSHVLRAMGLDESESRGALRVSLGWSTTAAEVDRFLDAFPAVVDRVRDGLAGRRAGLSRPAGLE
jgi:cysteine desulfurase